MNAAETSKHIETLKQAVNQFLEESGDGRSFAEILAYIDVRFNVVSNEMFKEWCQQEYPGRFTY